MRPSTESRRHADANLACPVCDVEGHHAIEADRGKHEGERREQTQQQHGQPALRYVAGKNLFHREDIRDWLIGVNPILGWGLSPGFRGSPDVTLAWKAVHDVAQGVPLGAEYYGDIGTLANRLPRDQQNRTLYAVMEIERKSWSLNFGIGHGLTPATDNWTVKAIVGISFN